jgi:hypothetical protein
MRTGRAGATALVVAALALAGPVASALAAPGNEVGMEDERLLLSEPAQAPRAVAEWAAAGVDVVRIQARWGAVSPGRDNRRRPAGFDVGDHADPGYDWATLDSAVDLVLAAGMRPMLTVTGPGPLWSSRKPSLHEARYKPDPQLFGRFARAVATRYRDRVDRYLIWNEPNQSGWLQPQWTCPRRHVCSPVAPHLYRGLVRAARPVIEAADPGAQVLLGELAPIGRRAISTRTPIAPLPFLRTMACVDARYRPLHRGACAGFKPASADAFGYHPHGVHHGPENPNPDRDQAQIADLPRLFEALDRLTRRGRIGAPRGRFDVYLTEFGYQTSPPDHLVGISLAQQSRFLQQGAYVAWRQPRVRNVTQYQWRDEPVTFRGEGKPSYAGWQSGLRFVNDRAKPSMFTFRTPFVVDVPPGRRRARLWGQVRPGTGPRGVTVLRLRRGGRSFEPIADLRTDANGYWSREMTVERTAKYRFAWFDPANESSAQREHHLSGVVDLASDSSRRLHASRP